MSDGAGAGGGSLAADRPFRGWWVVAGAFTVLFVIFGAAYSFPAFFDVLYAEWPGSRRDIALAFGIMGITYFAVGAGAGPLADRIDPRLVIGAGVVLVAAGLIAGSFARELWQFIAAYGVALGIGVGLAYVPTVGPVQRWFVRRRGMASGLAIAGIGVGTFASPIIATAIIGWSDWRTAYLALGAGALVLGLAGTALIIRSPQAVGQWPDGDRPAPGAEAPAMSGYTLAQAIRTRPFVMLYLASFALSFPLFVPFVHLVPSILDTGLYDKDTAVLVASLIGAGSLAGRFLIGPVSDTLGRRQTLIGCFIGLAVMLGLWLSTANILILGVFALVYGACYGGYVALVPSVTVDYLGPKSAGGILGVLYTSVGTGTFAGPVIVGALHDSLKDYTWPLVGCVVLAVLAAAIMALLPDPARWRAAEEARG